MKILLVHNDYGKYSGEEAVVDKMAAMFQEHGHEVCFYRRSSSSARNSIFGLIHGFFSGVYSFSGVKEMRKVLQQEKPDVINIHNLYPFISPAALFECKKASIPVIMTVHNFRLICPTGLFMRNERPCEICLEKGNEWSCLRYNCENSIPRSVGFTLRNVFSRITGAYKKNVDFFACITHFQRQKLIAAGFDANKIVVIPNSSQIHAEHPYTAGNYVAYCGRLSKEKGADYLFQIARKHPEISFKLAGAMREEEFKNEIIPNNCELSGYLSGEQLQEFYQKTAFCVMPSRCYEGFPMSILEAASYKKPTIGPDHGGFTEIIGRGEEEIGKLFIPNNEEDLEKKIVELWNNPEEVEILGNKAFYKLKKEYNSTVVYQKWEELFNKITISK